MWGKNADFHFIYFANYEKIVSEQQNQYILKRYKISLCIETILFIIIIIIIIIFYNTDITPINL